MAPLIDDGVNVARPSRTSDENLEDLTVVELRERLRAADLPVSGTKDELVDRLRRGDDAR